MSADDFLQKFDCFICNLEEAGIFFTDDYSEKRRLRWKKSSPAVWRKPTLIPWSSRWAATEPVYAERSGKSGFCPARKVQIRDTTGAGDSFCASVVSGLTYGCDLSESVEIGTRLAASVVTSSENVCPRFLPAELGIRV